MLWLPHIPGHYCSSLEVVTAYDILATDADSMAGAHGMLLLIYYFPFALHIAIMVEGNKSWSIFPLCLLWWGREEASTCLYISVLSWLVLNKLWQPSWMLFSPLYRIPFKKVENTYPQGKKSHPCVWQNKKCGNIELTTEWTNSPPAQTNKLKTHSQACWLTARVLKLDGLGIKS